MRKKKGRRVQKGNKRAEERERVFISSSFRQERKKTLRP
jgi:hypothetical protein